MKKLLVCLMALVMVAGCSSKEAATAWVDGTYTSTQTGFDSKDVVVTVTIKGGAIESCDIDASSQTPAVGGAAAETIAEALKGAKSVDFDTVSGATVTSEAIAAALVDIDTQALAK